MSESIDAAVIGLGPGGEHVAAQLAQAGLSVLGVEKHLVGGECPYYGCIPSKMMIRAAGALAEARRVPTLGGSVEVTPDWTTVAKRISDEATDAWNDQVAVDRLIDNGATFARGHGRLAGPGKVVVETADGTQEYDVQRAVVLNVGTEPAIPPVPGLAETPYWTNRDAVQVKNLPESMIVLGGGAIGCEIAQAFARFGVDVTILEVADRILGPEEPEASEVVAGAMADEGIDVRVGVDITRIDHTAGPGFTVSLGGGSVLSAGALLVAAGRRTNLSDLGLDTVGLDPSSRFLDTDEQVRAGDQLWAVGDITGKGQFTHMSMYQAEVAVRSILGKDGPWADYTAVSRATFTDPEVGSVGLTEKQARDAGIRVTTGSYSLPSSSRGWMHKTGNHGVIKVVADADRGVLVGGTTVGPSGGEMIGLIAAAVHAGTPVAKLRTMHYAYPTFHRAIENAINELEV
ncbi:dihydrolipoyl dehydrogenase family protein [Nocardioides bizhenqiangii]|uniref:NAD(P)/FAD-dependent oxidoreductase n=1 Tax=Nocardioides bizhenqiangii TaxID=3095076 RepID=A0ABZ0ZWD4_9ACTN|nr:MULTISPECIES: NAD(P)/FAD-dependent oxidoreductase [unclassified Nocardioides]MDZ5622192.1 NAD(P)/FAD-dependent oxidoreductase [Nocardioides sp. HM23]WQQ28629.1 NAD(P)/FAD-dependent oxidoreductase [Nocardioides sp. HM61]